MHSFAQKSCYIGLLAGHLIGCGAFKAGHKKDAAQPPQQNSEAPPPVPAATEPVQPTKDKSPDPAPAAGPNKASLKETPYVDYRKVFGKHFKTVCTVFKSKDALDNSVAVVYELEFSEFGGITQTVTTYTDAACTAPQIRHRSFVELSMINSQGSIDTTLTQASVTPLNDTVDRLWSKHQVAGYQNWENGIAFPVYGDFYERTDLTYVLNRKTVKVYQIYAIEGSKFYWGQLDDAHSGGSEEQRPVALDKALEFVAQP